MSFNYSVCEAKFTPRFFSDTNSKPLRVHSWLFCTTPPASVSHILVHPEQSRIFPNLFTPLLPRLPSAPYPKGMQKVKVTERQRKIICRTVQFRVSGAWILEIRNKQKHSTFSSSFYTNGSSFLWFQFKEMLGHQVILI